MKKPDYLENLSQNIHDTIDRYRIEIEILRANETALMKIDNDITYMKNHRDKK